MDFSFCKQSRECLFSLSPHYLYCFYKMAKMTIFPQVNSIISQLKFLLEECSFMKIVISISITKPLFNWYKICAYYCYFVTMIRPYKMENNQRYQWENVFPRALLEGNCSTAMQGIIHIFFNNITEVKLCHFANYQTAEEIVSK